MEWKEEAVPEREKSETSDKLETMLAIHMTEKEPISLIYTLCQNQKDVHRILEQKKDISRKSDGI